MDDWKTKIENYSKNLPSIDFKKSPSMYKVVLCYRLLPDEYQDLFLKYMSGESMLHCGIPIDSGLYFFWQAIEKNLDSIYFSYYMKTGMRVVRCIDLDGSNTGLISINNKQIPWPVAIILYIIPTLYPN